MKISLTLISFFILNIAYVKADDLPPIYRLNLVIKIKAKYTRQKEERIASLKRIKGSELSLLEQYQTNNSLYQEYKKFKIDTAIFYATQNLEVAKKLKNKDLSVITQLQLSNLYSSLGKFLESENILTHINRNQLSAPQLFGYYEAQIEFYEHYATNNYSETYVKLIKVYRDSLLTVLEPKSIHYQINLAEKNIYQHNLFAAQSSLLKLLPSTKKNTADYAMVTYLLAYSYQLQHRNNLAMNYYALSAITDVQMANKDNASIQNLALIFYEIGDIDNAFKYTKSAIEDAIFCNVKFRTLRMSELYTIINTSYLEKEANQKGKLQLYLVLISLLSVILILAVIYVYQQMKKVSRIKEKLHITSQQLAKLNHELSKNNVELSDINSQLSEANQVKEAYIAQFFDLCSTYINKLEDYRKALNKKANEKHLDELFKMLRSTTVVDNELEELYKVFDSIFLNLYPNFVSDFNALLIPESQVTVKPGELLNTELRIFALIRLGITDSVQIAAFLRYSLSTIYNYRTKARNKASVSRNDFEKQVTKIGMLPIAM
ncbi:DUF6377 domain-containing protein [Mucilaginibacter robiniae]|uniref:DUF6377 domain-containing protein n=1 Tax=Mucilaginibacter robiniae TaxID=2728022 RepID=UPI001B7D235F|nr:DUF6377 domain-containing protein [Mucilaginibacter robiniae]